MTEETWDLNDKLFMVFFIALSCGVMALLAGDFVGIITDLWFGFDNAMMEFGRVIEQLPV